MAEFGTSPFLEQELAAIPDIPLPRARPGPFEQAQAQYPILQELGLVPKYSYGQHPTNMLEFWPPGEPGPGHAPRPSDIPLDAPGVEIYNKNTRPIDVLGDVVSHHLIEKDPKIAKTYEVFKSSLNDDQRERLKEQYQFAKKNLGEDRSYPEWEKSSGLPAYFRGYAFDQWPKEATDIMYTPKQKALFDSMMQYLQKPRGR